MIAATTTPTFTLGEFKQLGEMAALELPEAVCQLIAKLSKEVGPSTVVQGNASSRSSASGTSTTTTAGNGHTRRGGGRSVAATVTAAPPPKQEENSLSKVRLMLNKLTDKNFDEYSQRIVRTLHLTGAEEISADIFTMASSNTFYSKIYASLFVLLISHFPIMTEIFQKNVAEFFARFDNIKYVDSSTDYEGFCQMNEAIDRRKALSTFFVNLTKLGVMSPAQVADLVHKLLQKFAAFYTDETKKNECDEMREHISILLDAQIIQYLAEENRHMNYQIAFASDDTESIFDFIRRVAKCTIKTTRGLTSKTLFKFIDIAAVLPRPSP